MSKRLFGFYSDNFVFHVFIVSILGAAKFSVEVSSVNIKFSFFFLFLFFLLDFFNKKISFFFLEIFFFFLILLSGVLSLYFSVNKPVSIYYLFWVLADFFVVYGFFRRLSSEKGLLYIKSVYLASFRIQIILSFFLFPFIHTYDGRVSLFYYEPSYFSIAAIPYIAFVIADFYTKESSFRFLFLDFFLIFLLLLLTKSANLMLVIFCSFLFCFLFSSKLSIFNRVFLLLFLSFFSFLGLLVVYYFNKDNLIISTIFHIFSSSDYAQALLARTGNRWPRMLLALDVVRNNFPNGIGMGVFKYYTQNYTPEADYSHGIPYLNPIGMPATNIWFEILAEAGVLGLTGFLGLVLLVSFRVFMYLNKGFLPVFVALLTFFVSLSFESSYLRIYYWAFIGVAYGSVLYYKKSMR